MTSLRKKKIYANYIINMFSLLLICHFKIHMINYGSWHKFVVLKALKYSNYKLLEPILWSYNIVEWDKSNNTSSGLICLDLPKSNIWQQNLNFMGPFELPNDLWFLQACSRNENFDKWIWWIQNHLLLISLMKKYA